MKKISPGVTDIVLAVLGVAFLVGIRTFFRPCGPMEDGGWMTCHWAGQAVTGVAGALLALAVIHLFAGERVKIGLDLALAALSILAVSLPGHLIGLCMMRDMRCRSVMTPGVTVLAILTILAAAADIFIRYKKDKT